MAGIYSQGGSAGHRYAGWLSEVEAKNFTFGGKVFNGSPSAIYVGSNLVWGSNWLKPAAQKAILGAFGQRDGWAVINATNAYLNQLAASGQAGKDKATALAGFINEDPMMVCSLPMSEYLPSGFVMPVRYMDNQGKAFFFSGVTGNGDNRVKLSLNLSTGFGTIFGSDNGDGVTQFTLSSGNWGARYGNGGAKQKPFNNTGILDVDFNKNNLYVNGTLLYNFGYESYDNGIDMPICTSQRKTTFPTEGNGTAGTKLIARMEFSRNDVLLKDYIPFISATRTGGLDLVNMELHQNQGPLEFIAAYTRNGQPWTPSTP